MSVLVLDTSALLAVFFNESLGEPIALAMEEYRASLLMSTVNLAECLILIEDRRPQTIERVREELLASSIRFIPPTAHHAKLAAEARLRYPINLGDCFAYALAKDEDAPILTLDADFSKTDLHVYPIQRSFQS